MRLSRPAVLLAVFAGWLPVGVSAQSLEDALAIAYRTNPTIRAERARLRATQELTAQARAPGLPQISGSASYTSVSETSVLNGQVFDPQNPNPQPVEQEFDFNTLAGGVQAEQVVFQGFQNINAIRQAKARVRAGGAQLAATEQQVLLDVATAYFDVLRDTTIFESNSNQVEVLRRQLDEANARFRVGEVTRTDVSQAEARLARARSGLSAAQAQLAISRAAYREFVGEAPATLEAAPGLPQLPDSIDAAQNLAREYAPAVVAARETSTASDKQVAIAKGAFLPRVSVTAGYQYADEPSSFTLSDEQFSYGARASMPIFLGGLNLSRVREARALADSAEANVDVALRRVEAQVTGAYEQLLAAQTTIVAAETQVRANELALEGVRREAQLGTRTTLDVLDAEQERLNAVVDLASARRDERVAAFSLLAASGLLTLEAIGVDPEAVLADEE